MATAAGCATRTGGGAGATAGRPFEDPFCAGAGDDADFNVADGLSCTEGVGFGFAASPATWIWAMVVPIGTTAFSWNKILPIVPATGEGISESTLSVAISRIVSSTATGSPSFLTHLRIVASMILSPILGMIKSTVVMGAKLSVTRQKEVSKTSRGTGDARKRLLDVFSEHIKGVYRAQLNIAQPVFAKGIFIGNDFLFTGYGNPDCSNRLG